MKNFKEIVIETFEWIMNVIFAVILIGGGAWVIKLLFF
jgi:hypothetical protein